jgi:ParB family chromosome partitioning protein
VRYLTMGSKQQQKDWLKLFESEEGNAPFGYSVKQWLFGGQSIPTKAALFPLDDYKGHIVADLFGEDSYFADGVQFWELQNAAIAAKREALIANKWSEVAVLEPGEHFEQWTYVKMPKSKGGKVYITVSDKGDVEIHEGWLSRKESRKSAKANGKKQVGAEPVVRPAMTQAMENYVELHRHGAVRLAILSAPSVAYRLLVAHAIASSGNWTVKPDPQRTRSKEIASSVSQSLAQAAFDAERNAVCVMLGLSKTGEECSDVTNSDQGTARIFARLLAIPDADVQRIASFAMAQSLAAGSAVVEAVGNTLKPDSNGTWAPEDAFFELLRDRATANAMLAEVAGEAVAKGNRAEKLKVQKHIILDHLAGKNDRPKVENWLPGWMEFPFRAYGEGTCSIARAMRAAQDALA